jgi:2-polyprenyl-3-methyl-5-hydroxy-6-metoxy-1,4-benzoquinol methylase
LLDTEIVLPEGPLKRCPACGHIVSGCSEGQFNRTMQEFDAPEGTWPTAKGLARQQKRARRILKTCGRFMGKSCGSLRLLDIGCSSGAFLFAVGSLGVAAEGVEPSSQPVQTALSRGLKVYQGFLEDVDLAPESYDVATLMEVIEHVKTPLTLLRECFRLLVPGGLVVVKTGNTDSWTAQRLKERWEYYDMLKHGGHISFFNPVSMRLMAERSGFQLLRIKTRKVTLYNKHADSDTARPLRRLLSNLLNRPAEWAGRGHEMVGFLQKPPTLTD